MWSASCPTCSTRYAGASWTRENREDQERLREQFAERERKPLLALEDARANRERVAFDDLPVPSFTGTQIVEPDLATLREYIDWQFFFHAWELKGRFPAILERPEARELLRRRAGAARRDRARRLVARRAGVYGFWPAHADGDDVVLDEATRFSFLRQQSAYGDSRPNRSLADYVAPEGDHLGAFAVGDPRRRRARRPLRGRARRLQAIMAKALADRLAEACAEWLHERARREWYEPGDALSSEDLIAERFRGIRPAFGYPACPDHTEKRKLFELLGAEATGLALTETYAMMPGRRGCGRLLRAPGGALLLGGPDRPRPGRGLRGAQGLGRRGGGALARPQPRLYARRAHPRVEQESHIP